LVLFDLGDTLVDNHPVDEATARRSIARGFELWLRRRATRDNDEFTPDERVRLAAVGGGRLVDAAHRGLAEVAQAYWANGREGSSQTVFAHVRAELAASAGLVASISELEEVYLKASQARQRVVPGAIDLLRSLRQAGARTGVVSNCVFSREPMDQRLGTQGLLGWLDRVIYTSEIGWRKPRPEPFLAALSALGSVPAGAVFLGDSLAVDMAGAIGAGLAGVWVWGYNAELRSVPPGPPRGPGTWPDLADRPALARVLDGLPLASAAATAGSADGAGRIIGAARTLHEAGEILSFAGH
jgi:putative hydrolase of the HAD superfamily